MTQFVIGSGQSGAMGGRGMEGGDTTVNEHVFIWTDAGWKIAAPGVGPLQAEYNNVMWNACKDLQAATGEDVYFVLSGKGSTPISEWADGQEQWNNLDAAAAAAMASPELEGKTSADYFYWYHGSSDNGNEHYADDFMDLRSRAIGSGWLAEDTVTVVGETRRHGEAKEALLSMIASGNNEWLHFAYNDGLTYRGLHPTGASCVKYGREFYRASQEAGNDLTGKFAYDHFEFGSRMGDSLSTDADNTMLLGRAGNDIINATGEGSFLHGGPGNDVFSLRDFGEITIIGGRGFDKLHLYLETGETYDMLDIHGIERVRVHYDVY